jgi:mono/diheme cytochrome c family protein
VSGAPSRQANPESGSITMIRPLLALSVIVAADAALAAAHYSYSDWQAATATHARAPHLRDPALVARGEQLYLEHCASCHGVELEGQPGWQRPLPDGGLPAPPHDPDGHTWHHPDRLLFEITKFGGQALAPPEFKSNMPAFGQTLSDPEIWAVLAFIKSRWPEEIRARQEEITRANP